MVYVKLVFVSDTGLLKGVFMDTKFSVALHILTMISESKESLSSQALAESVGTNASYIRKVLVLLKKANLVSSSQGKVGYQLNKAPNKISLLEIYYATQEIDHLSLFQVHQNANLNCPVGRYIKPAVTPIFADLEAQLTAKLSSTTLADVIENMYQVAQRK